jgi:hypothetical protein
MATGWQTFPIELRGGMVTSLGPLQLGTSNPGAARFLQNFEPSVEGGYKRVLGFNKFNPDPLPPYGRPLVQGSGQTGDSLTLADIHTPPRAGDTFTIEGIVGTFTVVSVTSWDDNTKIAALNVAPGLPSSPPDKAVVIFNNNSDVVNGVFFFSGRSYASRNSDIWSATATSPWEKVNIPSYGSVVVNGAGQTGSTLNVSGLLSSPGVGDTFSILGVELVYTVVNSTNASITFTPALASSPVDGASLSFLTTSRTGAKIVRYTRYNYTGFPTICLVDGFNVPATISQGVFRPLNSVPADIVGAEHVVEYKSSLFFSKGTKLFFTAPFTDNDFEPANGAGVINIAHTITGLIVFREQLIIFAASKIFRLTGNTISDFVLQPITQDIGCVGEDTIQEIGGDILFLGPDGLRLLSATERNNDFGFAVASRPIQKEVTDFTKNTDRFCSVLIREKSQYRILGFKESTASTSSIGYVATQFTDQSANTMSWAELRGFKAYVADSFRTSLEGEIVLFANGSGYIYRMEQGNLLDNVPIMAYYYSPFFVMDQSSVRKTFYKVRLYTDPNGSVSGSLNLRLDFSEVGVLQPPTIQFSNFSSGVPLYGSATYGTSVYGGKLVTAFESQLVGSGFSTSLEYSFTEETPPFSLDAVTIEFAYQDRQ